MPPSRAPPLASPTSVERTHALSLLTEYTQTIDALPIDLSRNFADLRELDAVRSTAVAQLTARIHQLADAIQEGELSAPDRLWKLIDISEDAKRLYMNSQDKIRVACNAADALKDHTTHLNALLSPISAFEYATVPRKTTYPHVSAKHYPVPTGFEPKNTRRRGVVSYVAAQTAEASPTKQRKRQRDDDGELVRPPKKEKGGDGAAPKRGGGGRAKKQQQQERAASPTESLLSVTSHIPQTTARTAAASRAAATKRARAAAAAAAANANLNGHGAGPSQNDSPSAPSPKGHPQDLYNGHSGPPNSSSGHPSLPSSSGHNHRDTASGWGVAHNQLEGPGMPVARSHVTLPTATSNHNPKNNGTPMVDDDEVDDDKIVDGEEDTRIYCFCQRVSFGDMVACDAPGCPYEWFHLPCIGITDPKKIPTVFYCDECKPKMPRKAAVRGGRGGKRRPGGKGRGGAH